MKTEANKSYCQLLRLSLTIFFFSLLISVSYSVRGQSDSVSVNKKRLRAFTIAFGAGYGSSLVGMNYLWYKNSKHQSFRFFNDNKEWKQVDKLGHFYSAFYFSSGTSRALQWCNVPVKKSDAIGALTGFLVLVPIEIFDGFSDAYGASGGDLVADAAGASFYLGQQAFWGETRLIPKFSFHQTRYANLRPSMLGENAVSQIFKDYNGQAYWLSADMDKFINFPKWLNLAVGYGAQGMVYARDVENELNGYKSKRQYYIALDFDLTAIQTRSRVLKTLILIASAIKLPSPALEFSNKKVSFHPLYF